MVLVCDRSQYHGGALVLLVQWWSCCCSYRLALCRQSSLALLGCGGAPAAAVHSQQSSGAVLAADGASAVSRLSPWPKAIQSSSRSLADKTQFRVDKINR